MRRKDRELTAVEDMLGVIEKCKVCRLAMMDGEAPYIVPLNFGYAWEKGVLELYFHGAREGKKIALLRANPRVCFEMDCGHRLIEADIPSGYSYAYESVIGFGRIVFPEDPQEKRFGLEMLMKHQTGRSGFVFSESDLERTCVYKLTALSFTGKRRPVPESGA